MCQPLWVKVSSGHIFLSVFHLDALIIDSLDISVTFSFFFSSPRGSPVNTVLWVKTLGYQFLNFSVREDHPGSHKCIFLRSYPQRFWLESQEWSLGLCPCDTHALLYAPSLTLLSRRPAWDGRLHSHEPLTAPLQHAQFWLPLRPEVRLRQSGQPQRCPPPCAFFQKPT